MISEGYFLEKVSELASMRCLNITKATGKEVFKRFEDFDAKDIDQAIETLTFSEERFDFVRLLKACIHRRADRLESRAEQDRKSEEVAARDFFDVSSPRYSGECQREQCWGCPYVGNCKPRAKEWMKGVNTILNSNLGKKGADELIDYMKNEFMGGI
jgi:hypothetical protein